MEYTYDQVGNVVTIKDYKVSGGTQTQAFTYDSLDRLHTAQAAGGIGEQGQYNLEAYAYYPNGNVQTKAGVSYGYTDAAHKHAVTTLGGVQKYWYDANGNMTTRIVGSDTYVQTWDAENRLVQVSKNGGVVATYVYDGDGNRVKATVGTVTTAYVGNYYEWTGSVATMVRYYYLGGQRIVMRQGSSTQYWLLTDHLGSTAITANVSGGKSSELRYKAYGETRYTWGTMATDYRFTGQKLDSSVGLYLMGARWYDSSLSRWLSPDSIVPEPANPQSFNRYSYVRNNPIAYVDPSGHHEATECDEDPALCQEDVDPNAVLEAWANCLDCNQNLVDFYLTLFIYQAELKNPDANPFVLDALLQSMAASFDRAQKATNEDIWSAVAGFAPEASYALAAIAVQVGKDISGNITGGGILTTPYQCHYAVDQATGKLTPMAIDTNEFTSGSKTRSGGTRNSVQFWQRWLGKFSGTLSDANRARIESKLSPKVDEVWVHTFPEHAEYMGQTIEHAHMLNGRFAIPLPMELHRLSPNWGYWH